MAHLKKHILPAKAPSIEMIKVAAIAKNILPFSDTVFLDASFVTNSMAASNYLSPSLSNKYR